MKTIHTCYPGGRYKALTLSYDDGVTADRRLVEILNRHGIKATFHLNSGLLDQGNRIASGEVASLYAGHEVAAHTVTHPTIARCPIDQVAYQILEDRRALEALVGYPVRGLSYPNGSYSRDIKKMLPWLGIEYGRIVGNSGGFGEPSDFYEWKSTCHHNGGLLERAEEFLGFTKHQYNYLFYVWGHAYEFDNDDNWQLIEDFCRLVGGRDDIWYTTNLGYVAYRKALDQLQVGVEGCFAYNPTATELWVTVDGRAVLIPGGQQVSLG